MVWSLLIAGAVTLILAFDRLVSVKWGSMNAEAIELESEAPFRSRVP